MTADKTPTDALEPCPFCNGRAQLNPVARDWWRIVIDHEEYCALSGHYDDVIVPQDDESRAWLIDRWNTRANCGSPVVAGEPVAEMVPFHTPSGKRVAVISRFQHLPIGTKLYTTPQPTQAADSVQRDAALLHYALADGGNQSMNWTDIYEDWDGEGYFIDALRAAYRLDAARKQGGSHD